MKELPVKGKVRYRDGTIGSIATTVKILTVEADHDESIERKRG